LIFTPNTLPGVTSPDSVPQTMTRVLRLQARTREALIHDVLNGTPQPGLPVYFFDPITQQMCVVSTDADVEEAFE